MACQSMLIVLIGAVPEYHFEEGAVSQPEVIQPITFTEDVDSIVTEVRD